MWYEWLGKVLSQVGSKLAVAGAAVVAVFLLIFGHRRKVSTANKQGVKTGVELERDRVRDETERTQERIKERVDEIEKDITNGTADRDDLLDRMRRESTDHRNKS